MQGQTHIKLMAVLNVRFSHLNAIP